MMTVTIPGSIVALAFAALIAALVYVVLAVADWLSPTTESGHDVGPKHTHHVPES